MRPGFDDGRLRKSDNHGQYSEAKMTQDAPILTAQSDQRKVQCIRWPCVCVSGSSPVEG